MSHLTKTFVDTAAVQPKKIVNRVALLLDVSGSMARFRTKLVELANEQIQKLMELSRETKQEVYLRIYTFNHQVKLLREGYIHGVGIVRPIDAQIEGDTALYDAFGIAIRELAKTERPGEDVGFLVVALTDGQENASYRYNADSAVEPTNLAKWTIAALVPRGSRGSIYCTRYQVREWDVTAEGIEQASSVIKASMTNYAGTRSTGAGSTSSYFVDPADAAWKGLTPAPKQKWTRIRVDGNEKVEISDFIKGKLGKYKLGDAYYELTKRERVQGGKDFLVGHYNGDILDGVFEGDVRKAIGLPSGADVRVAPGTTKDKSVKLFVQSTSVNRHLLPGTDVLVRA